MCNIESIDQLIEKLSIEEIEEHLNHCKECRKKYSNTIKKIYPDIKINIKVKEEKHFLWLRTAIALFTIIAVLFVFSVNRKGRITTVHDYYYLLNDSDYGEMIDKLDIEQFNDLFNFLEEDL